MINNKKIEKHVQRMQIHKQTKKIKMEITTKKKQKHRPILRQETYWICMQWQIEYSKKVNRKKEL